jgi:hypothetical protein
VSDLADVFAGMATIKLAEGDKLRFKYEIPSRILGGVMGVLLGVVQQRNEVT